MPAPRKFSEEIVRQILSEFHSDMSGVEIGKKYKCDYSRTVRRVWLSTYSSDDMKERNRRLCSLHKVGNKNPMFGKIKAKHHNYKEIHYSTQGYRWIDCPDWYTGSTDKNKAPEHIVIACEAAGITELPIGCIVHHKDENKLNNHPSNLEIMNRGKHMVTHRWLRYKKKVQRLSREGVQLK